MCAAIALLLTVLSSVSLFAHCEIPCGIYGDDARFKSLAEDLKTIEKSMVQIQALSLDPGKNMNQLVRWVNNKETHADHIRDTISQYFLAQRIKAPATGDAAAVKDYTQNLQLLHKMIVSAMKCKQTVDQKHVKELHDLLHKFQSSYQK
jgi:cobalamin biosynthesis Co2+ chelatase CbiK